MHLCHMKIFISCHGQDSFVLFAFRAECSLFPRKKFCSWYFVTWNGNQFKFNRVWIICLWYEMLLKGYHFWFEFSSLTIFLYKFTFSLILIMMWIFWKLQNVFERIFIEIESVQPLPLTPELCFDLITEIYIFPSLPTFRKAYS